MCTVVSPVVLEAHRCASRDAWDKEAAKVRLQSWHLLVSPAYMRKALLLVVRKVEHVPTADYKRSLLLLYSRGTIAR